MVFVSFRRKRKKRKNKIKNRTKQTKPQRLYFYQRLGRSPINKTENIKENVLFFCSLCLWNLNICNVSLTLLGNKGKYPLYTKNVVILRCASRAEQSESLYILEQMLLFMCSALPLTGPH